MTSLLFLLACVEEPEPLTEATFFDAYARSACDQLAICEPHSWRALRGDAICQIEQENQVRAWLWNDCTSLDLANAQACLDAMAATPCDRLLVQGDLPEACWEVQVFDEDACFPIFEDDEDLPAAR